MIRRRRGMGDGPTLVPIDQATPPPTSSCGPPPPTGYWVDPTNCTTRLPPDQGAKVGKPCFNAPFYVGKYTAGGNYENSALYCGQFFDKCGMDELVFGGGLTAAALFLLPSPWRWIVGIGIGGFSALRGTLGCALKSL